MIICVGQLYVSLSLSSISAFALVDVFVVHCLLHLPADHKQTALFRTVLWGKEMLREMKWRGIGSGRQCGVACLAPLRAHHQERHCLSPSLSLICSPLHRLWCPLQLHSFVLSLLCLRWESFALSSAVEAVFSLPFSFLSLTPSQILFATLTAASERQHRQPLYFAVTLATFGSEQPKQTPTVEENQL